MRTDNPPSYSGSPKTTPAKPAQAQTPRAPKPLQVAAPVSRPVAKGPTPQMKRLVGQAKELNKAVGAMSAVVKNANQANTPKK